MIVVGRGWNRTSCRKGTAVTARRRHQPVLMGTTRNWLRVTDSNRRSPGYEPSEITASLTRDESCELALAGAAGTSAVDTELAEGEGVEPSTSPLARFSRPVARRRAPPSMHCRTGCLGENRTPDLAVRTRVFCPLNYETAFSVPDFWCMRHESNVQLVPGPEIRLRSPRVIRANFRTKRH